MEQQDRALITVWSDYVCPFCYLEEPVLHRIREAYGRQVEIRWRAFELRPAPTPTLDPRGEYLRTTWQQAVHPMAARRGMTLHLPPVQPRSRHALEAAEFAREQGRFEAMHGALFRAFFEDGRNIGAMEVLRDIGRSTGLDAEDLQAALEEGRHTDQVLRDRRLAQEAGVSGVPAMLVGPAGSPPPDGELIMGAQPHETLASAVERALGPRTRRADPAATKPHTPSNT